MDPEQRAIHAQIVESRSTGAAGPFGPWLANPAVAQPSQELGRVVRYETSFPIRVSELAILVTAARTRCGTEWAIHCREARKAGLTDEIIGHLLAGTATAEHFDDPLDRAVWRFADELTQQCRVSDDVYDELVATTVGTKGAVELVALCGYYTYVAMTLNVFRIPPPKNYL
jgi:4-carboxymuconolactone decarboxylase